MRPKMLRGFYRACANTAIHIDQNRIRQEGNNRMKLLTAIGAFLTSASLAKASTPMLQNGTGSAWIQLLVGVLVVAALARLVRASR
ncbi:hypothetical protein CSC82_00680 [Rhodobacteraceae bacterium 4F10]|nr:hypothetical protein CSC82_00680 [Rhodobacteraceae bacterium 4F10]